MAMALPAQTIRYIAPASGGGSDSNNGLTSGAPWLTPNHPLTAPTVILAAAGTFASPTVYASANFYNQKWGACTSTGDLCWIKCATPFGCSITETSEDAMFVSASYWGVQGFQISSTGSGGCVGIAPSYGDGLQIHHLVFANNIVGPCVYDGIGEENAYDVGPPTTGVDYLAYLGNITFDTGGSSSTCSAGLSFYAPVASDTLPGTHHYMAGNFSWGNTSNCGDGEGIIFDTLDGVEAGWPNSSTYSQQMVAENNITVWNNGPGIQVDLNQNGSGPWAPVYFLHNTSAYNNQGPSTANYCGEIIEGTTVTAYSSMNLVDAPTQYCFGGGSVTHFGDDVAYSSAATIKVYGEFAYNANGNGVGQQGSSGFVAGPNNITATDPVLANPVKPPTPNCTGFSTTTACMATLITDYAPTNAAAKNYGYQTPSSTSVYNALYPQWLCSVTNLPIGLVTPGCTTGMNWK